MNDQLFVTLHLTWEELNLLTDVVEGVFKHDPNCAACEELSLLHCYLHQVAQGKPQ